MRRRSSPAAIGVAALAILSVVAACSSPLSSDDPSASTVPVTAAPGGTTTTTSTTTTTTTIPSSGSTTTTEPGEEGPEAPPPEDRYVVPDDEVEREAKQLAADIAYALTTYEASDIPAQRFANIAGYAGVSALRQASEPLTHDGQWSRGKIYYPQLGGLTSDKVSVMVVTGQTVGSGEDPEFSLVRTLDVRLVLGDSGWEFDRLASAGGAFDSLEDLTLAHAVANDPRIEMPDSARLDILAGEITPLLLEVMADIADRTPYWRAS